MPTAGPYSGDFTGRISRIDAHGNRTTVAEKVGSGQVVQIDPDGHQTVIATGLSFPTAMTMGPDGALFVSNLGFGPPVPGLGQILRITIPD